MQRILGNSAENRPIECQKLSEGPVNLLLVGGVHGDEPEGFYLVERFIQEGGWQSLEGKASLYVIPRLNPDGCAVDQRMNGNRVDLNRNMPTKDWSSEAKKERYQPGPHPGSEPETKILIALIEEIKPHAIISCHSWEPMINYNGPCQNLAEEMKKWNEYRIADDIGYPTPGSLGTWAGWERKIPTITLEIEKGLEFEKIWQTHSTALLKGLEFAASHKSLGV